MKTNRNSDDPHPISATTAAHYAAAQRDRDEWLQSASRLAWLCAEGVTQ